MSKGMKLFYIVIALVIGTIGYRGLTQKPVKASEAAINFSCVEFNSEADAKRFYETDVIPAGSKLSTKSAIECKGVRLASK